VGLLAVIVLLEVGLGTALRSGRSAHHQADVVAIPGVAGMIRDAQIDPTELAQVASQQHRLTPGALPALAVLVGLWLVAALALALPRLMSGRDLTQAARRGVFVGGLAILLGAMAVGVRAISRLRYLVALYRSPPVGTVSYLLLYGSFPQRAALIALTAVMVLKVAAALAWSPTLPATSSRAVVGLAVTSVGATVVTAGCYVLAPTTLGAVTDALAAAAVALAAVLWAGILVSGEVRRLT
jgi:hypothetical protein